MSTAPMSVLADAHASPQGRVLLIEATIQQSNTTTQYPSSPTRFSLESIGRLRSLSPTIHGTRSPFVPGYQYPHVLNPQANAPLDIQVALHHTSVLDVHKPPIWIVRASPLREGFPVKIEPGLEIRISDGVLTADGNVGRLTLMERRWVFFEFILRSEMEAHDVMTWIATPRAWCSLDVVSALRFFFTYPFLPNTLPSISDVNASPTRAYLIPTKDGLERVVLEEQPEVVG